MSIQTTSYSTFLSKVCALIGVPYSGMNSDEKANIKTFFDTQIHSVWGDNNWLDICPYGEARFAGNLLTYPNDLAKTNYWTSTALTVTANNLANPCDGRVTASKCLETTANSAHSVSQAYTFIPSITYQYSAWVRGAGRSYVELVVNDGTNSYTAFFNVSTGVIGTYSNNLTQAPTITQGNNGFWLCTLYFTTAATASTGYASTLLSTDGSTTSYAGDATKGVYSWGQLLLQTEWADPTSINIPYIQTGESTIDVVFQVWASSPSGALNPRPQGYLLTPDAIQIIGPGGYWTYGVNFSAFPNGFTPAQNPFYLLYRKLCPTFIAGDYDSASSYVVGDQILFTDGDNILNFWKCVVDAAVGETPDTTPNSWELLEIPLCFLSFCVYAVYADWLRFDGQIEKAAAMDDMAQRFSANESDKQERQAGQVMPMKVSNHVTSQARTW